MLKDRVLSALLMLATTTCVCAETAPPVGAKNSADSREADKKALAPAAGFVGEWRGVGSVKASSGADAWTEESEWSWDFKGGRAALTMASPNGRYFSAGRLEPAEKTGTFRFVGTSSGGKVKEEFGGEFNKEGDLVLTNAAPADNRPVRLTLSLVAKGKRMLFLYQRKERRDVYMPIAELGLTLKGSGFGKQTDERECVVTGGRGKMTVEYKGKTYYVCCGGCKDSFLENPEKELAAFHKRKAEEKAAR